MGGSRKNNIQGNCLNRGWGWGGLGQFADLRGGGAWRERDGGGRLRG